MALNTEPLSPQRQAVMLFVLLILFVGSVAFAHTLVQGRRSHISFSVSYPSGFTHLHTPPFHGLYDARAGQINGLPRNTLVFFYESAPLHDSVFERAEATRLFQRVFGSTPDAASDSILAGNRAAYVRGRTPDGFALLRLTVVADRALALIYTGPGNPTDIDYRAFDILSTDAIRLSVNGELKQSRSRLRREAPATVPEDPDAQPDMPIEPQEQ